MGSILTELVFVFNYIKVVTKYISKLGSSSNSMLVKSIDKTNLSHFSTFCTEKIYQSIIEKSLTSVARMMKAEKYFFIVVVQTSTMTKIKWKLTYFVKFAAVHLSNISGVTKQVHFVFPF